MKFYLGLGIYVVLAVLAWQTLDGNLRLAVWVFLGGLAVKSYVDTLRKP